ncbi:hypothetical protein [Atopobacter phocae]|uniref:hypothetical protein n=1 Tax=Atopobacter phocae TaxID=136492 RepID=UPI0004B74A0B|nr:hypothetical protein [Atopobacter phocae]
MNKRYEELDQLTEDLYNHLIKHDVTMAEVAAINFYLMKRALESPHNMVFLKECLKLDVSNLSIEGLFKMQQALTEQYIYELQQAYKD